VTSIQGSGIIADLIAAARSEGLQGIVAAIGRGFDCEVGLFDVKGSVLAVSPERAIWQFERVLELVREPGKPTGLTVRKVALEQETVALLALGGLGFNSVVLDAAEGLVAIELSRLRGRQEGRRELASNVIDDILGSRLSEPDAINRLQSIGVDTDSPFRVLLGKAPGISAPALAAQWGFHSLMNNSQGPFVRVARNDTTIMIVPDDVMVNHIASTLLHNMSGSEKAVVGVSFPHVGGAGFRAAYFEALAAARGGRGVCIPAQLDIGQLLIVMGSTSSLVEVVSSVLQPLVDYDASHNGTLIETLRAHLVANRVALRSAEALFIHRNTLRYRLQQIESLLGVDIESTEAISNLWLALLILDGKSRSDGTVS
jgi:purine catabolism regulator